MLNDDSIQIQGEIQTKSAIFIHVRRIHFIFSMFHVPCFNYHQYYFERFLIEMIRMFLICFGHIQEQRSDHSKGFIHINITFFPNLENQVQLRIFVLNVSAISIGVFVWLKAKQALYIIV